MDYKKLAIVDGYGLFFRSYYSLPPLKTSSGIHVGAVYGFVNMVLKIVHDLTDSNVIVALDSGKSTFRDEISSTYKANRKSTPDDLRGQFAIMLESLDSIGLPHLSADGYEADDIISTYTRIAKLNDIDVTIITSDKDLMQLVSDGVRVYDPGKKMIFNEKEVVDKFGVKPKNIIDYLSLIGDASDNIPGVKSIGKKTAVELINQFETIENIYNNINTVGKKSVRDALMIGKESAIFSKKLITLCDSIETIPDLKSMLFKGVNSQKLKDFAIKYEFKNLVN